MTLTIFKDRQDLDSAYYNAKAIAQEIYYQIGEIEELKGYHEVDCTYITLNSSKRRIEIRTEFINEDNGKRYSWDEYLGIYEPTYDFLPKIIHQWFVCFAKDFQHGVYFAGYIE
jgi:hypothetical protein